MKSQQVVAFSYDNPIFEGSRENREAGGFAGHDRKESNDAAGSSSIVVKPAQNGEEEGLQQASGMRHAWTLSC